MKIKKPFLFALFLLINSFVVAQKYNKEYLQKENTNLRNQIAELNKKLSDNKNQSKSSIVYITNLNTKINTRAKLLNNTTKEKRFIEDDIYLKQLEINKHKRELAELRKNYGEVLVKAYKEKSVQNKILFVLTSKDLGQAYRRIKYLKLYADFQDEKADEINQKIIDINLLAEDRKQDILDKELLLAKQKEEVDKLELERIEKEKLVSEFKANAGQIQAELNAKKQKLNSVLSEIDKIIAEELKIARAKAAEEEKARKIAAEAERKRLEAIALAEAKKKAEAAKAEADRIRKINETKAESEKIPIPIAKVEPAPKPVVVEESKSNLEKLSDNFEANKGKLPRPVDRGTTVVPFGKSTHPILGITLDNPGIDIASPPNTKAKVVFDGTVSKIISIQGNIKAVIVRHGEYFTTYYNLDDVYVSQGQKVKTGEQLGHIYVDDNGDAILKFMINKESNKQNPENWIR